MISIPLADMSAYVAIARHNGTSLASCGQQSKPRANQATPNQTTVEHGASERERRAITRGNESNRGSRCQTADREGRVARRVPVTSGPSAGASAQTRRRSHGLRDLHAVPAWRTQMRARSCHRLPNPVRGPRPPRRGHRNLSPSVGVCVPSLRGCAQHPPPLDLPNADLGTHLPPPQHDAPHVNHTL